MTDAARAMRKITQLLEILSESTRYKREAIDKLLHSLHDYQNALPKGLWKVIGWRTDKKLRPIVRAITKQEKRFHTLNERQLSLSSTHLLEAWDSEYAAMHKLGLKPEGAQKSAIEKTLGKHREPLKEVRPQALAYVQLLREERKLNIPEVLGVERKNTEEALASVEGERITPLTNRIREMTERYFAQEKIFMDFLRVATQALFSDYESHKNTYETADRLVEVLQEATLAHTKIQEWIFAFKGSSHECGLPRKDFFMVAHKLIDDALPKITAYLEAAKAHAPLVKESKELFDAYHVMKARSRYIPFLHPLLERLKVLLAEFIAVAHAPVGKSQEVHRILDDAQSAHKEFLQHAIKSNPEYPGWFYPGSSFDNLFSINGFFFPGQGAFILYMFDRTRPKRFYYHAIGVNTGEQVEGSIDSKTPKEYVDSIIKRIDSGIRPTTTNRNYLCCAELPAVFYFDQMGKWGPVCFEFDPEIYPILRPGFQPMQREAEYVTYTFKPLPLTQSHIILQFFTSLAGTSTPHDAMLKVVALLPDVTPGGKPIKFRIECAYGEFGGRERECSYDTTIIWSPSEFRKKYKIRRA